MKQIKVGFSLGMVSAIVYMTHVFLGQLLWHEYNSITTDISSLTADGAPYSNFLRVLTTIYGICFLVFVVSLLLYSIKHYHTITSVGYGIMLVMALSATIGYSLFPLTADKAEMNFQNTMHILVTVVVVFTTIASLFILAFGYWKKEKQKNLGLFCLIFGILIFVFGVTNPIGIALNLNILGLTERLVIFILQAFVFIWSFLYTFKIKIVS